MRCLIRFFSRAPPEWAIELMADIHSVQFQLSQLQGKIMSVADDINARLDQTLEEVRTQTTKIDGINTLADGLRQQIIDLMNQTGVSQAVLGKVNILFDALKAQSAKVDDTLNENTPPVITPAPPAAEPEDEPEDEPEV